MTADYSGIHLDKLTLGKTIEYKDKYDASLLQAVPRSLNRDDLKLGETLPFDGVDLWNGYEISWLNSKGKPQVVLAEFEFPVDSPNIVESKSFKLYLNSFNQTKFDSIESVHQHFVEDLTRCCGSKVTVRLSPLSSATTIAPMPGESIDELDIEIDNYQLDSTLLSSDSNENVSETLCSDLLKSNCLITSQPDWASIYIRYQGPKICRESLLRYLISFRSHNEFHEQCVERIFCDLITQCAIEKLSVYARYTRRGGLDINPFRSNYETIPENIRNARQ